MKITIKCAAFFLVTVSFLTCAGNPEITINTAECGPRVNPDMYGLFFEEINHAGDGGLYAELVKNRSFEGNRLPEGTTLKNGRAVTDTGFSVAVNTSDQLPGWTLVASGKAKGQISLCSSNPLNMASPHSLQLDILSIKDGRVGVANSGYWGMSIRKGKTYDLVFYARAASDFHGTITATLENTTNTIYAQAVTKQLTTRWQKFECILKPDSTDPRSRLVLCASKKGTLWLDFVSLFPRKTWRGHKNGLRYDLAEMLATMKPGFLRFPGGCFVEGITPENAYRWKRTIGDPSNRPGHWCLWHYPSTDGLGFHEYLQFCEDAGCKAMFVINCGMTHGKAVEVKELGPWIQDALDAIEYARGPVTSKWGSVRAKNGHPKPFDLKYLEIGNENGGPVYNKHFGLFYKAVKKRYPDIITIANSHVDSVPMEILDEHYYSSPDFFIQNANRYDSYNRNGPKIYIGEFACTQGCGKGNLIAAIGEAAFMTGMERNSDIVIMSSYAPLFVNRDQKGWLWNPDLICFNSSSCYGTPSYFVQKLFSTNRPDYILPTTVSAPARIPRESGCIGVGTWLTQAEFKDIRVSQDNKTIFESDFSTGSKGWNPLNGKWSAGNNTYRQMDKGENMYAVAGNKKWEDYKLTLKARKIGGAEGFLILFHFKDKNHFYWWNIGGWGNSTHAIERANGGRQAAIGKKVPGRIETGRWYDIKIVVKKDRIQCYLDRKLVHDMKIHVAQSLYAVAGQDGNGKDVILKVVNVTSKPQETDVRFQGGVKIKPRGKVITLTSKNPTDENTFEEPLKVSPVSRTVEKLGTEFKFIFPPYSLNILRLKKE